jgi:uncharacterized membrane protein YccC
LTSQLLRNTLKLTTAIFLTAAIAVHYQRIQYVYYPLTAALIVVDDNDDQTWRAAGARVFGTAMGGLITFLVHTIASGWPGVLLTLLIIIPVLRLFGWGSGLGTACTITVMFLMIPGYSALNWDYVFNRTLDTSVGCAMGLLVGLLFWPRNRRDELGSLEMGLRHQLMEQLALYRAWIGGAQPLPAPIEPASLSQPLERMQQLVNLEQTGPAAHRLERRRWPQRLMLWRQVVLHWVQWERLLIAAAAPKRPSNPGDDKGAIAPSNPLARCIHNLGCLVGITSPASLEPVASQDWQTLAQRSQRPLLLLLALAEEQRPLEANLRSLALVGRNSR